MNVIGQPLTFASANADNAAAVATLAAPGVGTKWLVRCWGASFRGGAVATPVAASMAATATVARGVNTNSPWDVNLGLNGMEGADNGAVSITLNASGAAGTFGEVFIGAVKVPTNYSY